MTRLPSPTSAQLREQIMDPQHVFIVVGGNYSRHPHGIDAPYAGQPIRYTRLAAERILAQCPEFRSARLVTAYWEEPK